MRILLFYLSIILIKSKLRKKIKILLHILYMVKRVKKDLIQYKN